MSRWWDRSNARESRRTQIFPTESGPDGSPLVEQLEDGLCPRYPEVVRAIIYGAFWGGPSLDSLLTLATAHGLIRARRRWLDRMHASEAEVLERTYRRCIRIAHGVSVEETDGWDGALLDSEFLRTEVPGLELLSAHFDEKHTLDSAISALPTAIVGASPLGDRFLFGCEVTAILHDRAPSQYAGGYLAEVVGLLSVGYGLDQAATATLARLPNRPDTVGLAQALEQSLAGDVPALDARSPEDCLTTALGRVVTGTWNTPRTLSTAQDWTTQCIAAQLALASGCRDVPEAMHLQELETLSRDFAWEMGRNVAPGHWDEAWYSKYPPC